jgi:hypothetical protein
MSIFDEFFSAFDPSNRINRVHRNNESKKTWTGEDKRDLVSTILDPLHIDETISRALKPPK